MEPLGLREPSERDCSDTRRQVPVSERGYVRPFEAVTFSLGDLWP